MSGCWEGITLTLLSGPTALLGESSTLALSCLRRIYDPSRERGLSPTRDAIPSMRSTLREPQGERVDGGLEGITLTLALSHQGRGDRTPLPTPLDSGSGAGMTDKRPLYLNPGEKTFWVLPSMKVAMLSRDILTPARVVSGV